MTIPEMDIVMPPQVIIINNNNNNNNKPIQFVAQF
jgi:hypothetical protein